MPVLSRPQNATPLVDSIGEATKSPYTILFLCSPGDDAQIEACLATGAKTEVVSWSPNRSDYPKKMNLGFQLTKGEFVLMGADDLTFEAEWDTRALAVAAQTGVGVIGTDDCANKQVMRGNFSTHALVRRSYVEEVGASLDGPGVLVSESYDHNYCDREICHLAQYRGQWAFASDSRIKHRHPVWRTAKDDPTYTKGRVTAGVDHANFLERAEQWDSIGLLSPERDWIRRTRRRRHRLRGIR